MEAPRTHFVRIAGEVRGPVGVEQLRDLASVDVITPANEVATSATGPWVALESLPWCAEVFPARRVLGFKSTEFEQLNQGSAAAALDPNEAILQANAPPASFRGREVAVSPHGMRGPGEGDAPNEVQEMVLDVGRRVRANAPVVVLPPAPPRYARWRWFLTLAVLGSAGIVCIPLLYPDRKSDEFTFSILAGWIVLYNGFLVFVMVADREFSKGRAARKSGADGPE